MKWLKILIALAEILIPGLAKAGKNKLADELEIAQGVVKKLTSSMTPEEKGGVVLEVIDNLKAVKKFKTRVSNKIGKAGDRFVKKFL